MYKICRFDIERSGEIFEELRGFCQKLRQKFNIAEIFLYGSLATGEVNEGSDIDLLIVGDFKEPFLDRILKILELTELPIEPLVYDVKEFEEMKANKNPLIFEVLSTGKKM